MKAALPITIELEGSEALQKRLKKIEADLQKGKRLQEGFERAGELVAAAARSNAPAWRRDLYASIDNELVIDEHGFVAVVFSDREYAPQQERGTDPYYPAMSASLIEWCQDHGMNPKYVVDLIAARGLQPTKFFERALRDEEERIVELIGRAVGDILERTY